MEVPYQVILADDHVLFREGIKRVVEAIPGLQVVGEAGDGLELLGLLQKVVPNLLILDLTMPNLPGVGAAREIKRLYPEIRILILTMHKSKEYLCRGLAAGADGYLLKENAYGDLVAAIDYIREGKIYISSLISPQLPEVFRQQCLGGPIELGQALTPREIEVLRLLAAGMSSPEIAVVLHISTFTVQKHRSNIKKKLNISKNAELIKYAIREGYASSEE
jgi:DNA-binding NarL/FixJ family response regulator